MHTQPNFVAQTPNCTPAQAEEWTALHRVIGDNGFQIIPLPIIDVSLRWQMQRGDRIYDTFARSHAATLAMESQIEGELVMLRKFAATAKEHPAKAQ